MNARMLALLLCALTPLVCSAQAPEKMSPVERLQTLWRDDLSKRANFKVHSEKLEQLIFETKRLVVRDAAGEETAERIERVLAGSKRSLILTGDLAALRKHPKLTEVHNPGTFRNGFSAYFAPDDSLVLLWIIPEG